MEYHWETKNEYFLMWLNVTKQWRLFAEITASLLSCTRSRADIIQSSNRLILNNLFYNTRYNKVAELCIYVLIKYIQSVKNQRHNKYIACELRINLAVLT